MSKSFLTFLFFLSSTLFAQSNTILICQATANPPVIRGEGITERVGDIVLTCNGGQPGASISGNLSIFLSVPITNRILSNNSVPDVLLALDLGSGQVQLPVVASTQNTGLVFNGVMFNLSPTGSATLRILNVRGAASVTQLKPGALVFADLAFNAGSLLSITNNHFIVGVPQVTLLDMFSGKIFCSTQGSPLPDSFSFTNLLAAGTVFTTTRVTEGFASAFAPKGSPFSNFRADSGLRIIATYSGFPAGARLFVPDVVAGSSASQPTAGGDLGVTPSGGLYKPGSTQLLLSRVQGADSNGAGGTPIFIPPASGAAIAFDSVSELSLSGGSAYVVYEVVDSNPTLQESAQFPTFLGLAPGGTAAQTDEAVNLAPVSDVIAPSITAPIPRFIVSTPGTDCNVVGDCSANYFPKIIADLTPLQATAPSNGNFQVRYIPITNGAGGVLRWNITVAYISGSGYLRINPSSGVNNGTARVDFLPNNLAPGTYQATLTIDAGPAVGARTIPVTFVVTPAEAPPPVGPIVTAVTNAAGIGPGPVVPGSLATIWGTKLSGKVVLVTFDGLPGKQLYSGDSQINLLVPIELGTKTAANVIVTVDGVPSTAFTIALAPYFPGIFPGAILNQDNSVNSSSVPAKVGSVIQIFATGLPATGGITGRIGDRFIAVPYYGGPAPGLPGVQQVNLLVPSDIPTGTTTVSVCGASAVNPGSQTCSPSVPLTITP